MRVPDMRLLILLVGVGVLSTASAFAQTDQAPLPLGEIQCDVTAEPSEMRATGNSEFIGDVEFTCENVVSGPSGVFQQYVDAFATVNIKWTNRKLRRILNPRDSGRLLDIVDAVAVTNENNATRPTDAYTLGGPDARFGLPLYGSSLDDVGNSLFWALELPVPGAPNDVGSPPAECSSFGAGDPTGCFPLVTTIRLTNVRLQPRDGSFDDSEPTNLNLELVGTGLADVETTLNVGTSTRALTATVTPADPSSPCAPGEVETSLEFSEAFASALRPLGAPAFLPSPARGESGYPTPDSGTAGGGADHGTRLGLFIATGSLPLPAGIEFEVPNSIVAGTLELRRVDGGAFGTVVPPGGTFVGPGTSGIPIVYYEVLSADAALVESASIPVTIRWAAPLAAPATLGLALHLAPVTTADPPDTTQAIVPNFQVVYEPTPVLRFESCTALPCLVELSGLGSQLLLDATDHALTAQVWSTFEDCTWELTGAPGWISGPVGTQMGGQPLGITVAANSSGQERSATLSLAGQAVTVVQAATGLLFEDVTPEDFFHEGVTKIAYRGVTSGCAANPRRFCPDAFATRGQLAVFLVRAIFGTDDFSFSPTPYFTDVPVDHPFFPWIQKLRELEITSGCTATEFCPGAAATRGQIAVFIIRARYGVNYDLGASLPGTPTYSDVPTTHPFFAWIEKMAEVGITSGCASGKFCPGSTVTRGQIAIFVARALFNELLPAGTPRIVSVSPAIRGLGDNVAILVTFDGLSFEFQNSYERWFSVGPGVTVLASMRLDDTHILFDLLIDAEADTGPRSAVFDRRSCSGPGCGEAVLPSGFLVESAIP